MYDLPGMRAANVALWGAIAALLRRDGFGDVPNTLGADDGPEPGRSLRGMLFTQTCGYPLQTVHRGQLRLLATPTYDAPGCGAMTHRSFIVVRDGDPAHILEDLRGRRFAVNAHHSNSGMNLPRRLFAPLARNGRFFGAVTETGSHAASLARVQSKGADAAAIDCVTWAFAGDHVPERVAGLRVLAETDDSPALPFVTGADTLPALADALQRALLKIGSDEVYRNVRAGLRIRSIGIKPLEDYVMLLRLEDEAIGRGYPVLA